MHRLALRRAEYEKVALCEMYEQERGKVHGNTVVSPAPCCNEAALQAARARPGKGTAGSAASKDIPKSVAVARETSTAVSPQPLCSSIRNGTPRAHCALRQASETSAEDM